MKTIRVSIMMIVFCAAPVSAAPAPEAVKVLTQARAAAAALKSVSFDATVRGEGLMADRLPVISGRVLAVRGPTQATHKLYIEGINTAPVTAQTSTFRYACDGETAYSVVDQAKMFVSGKAIDGRTVERNVLFPPMYFDAEPFKTALGAASIESGGVQTIENVECDVVRLVYDPAGRRRQTLYFGRQDHLLRRTEQPLMPTRSGESRATLVFTASGLQRDPDLGKTVFSLVAPEGYRLQRFSPIQTALRAPRPAARALPAAKPAGDSRRLAAGVEAPDWTLTDSHGKEVSLKSLRGKIVVLDFWATWCGPCRKAMPGMQKLHERFKGKPVAVYGVNCKERNPRANPMAYIKQQGYTYGQLLNGNAVARAYGVSGIPAFRVIDKDGKFLYLGRGYRPDMDDILASVIEKALNESTGSR